ncbi:hypothetical protein ACHWQZ_G015687 [Mnemiopsis leidyi]
MQTRQLNSTYSTQDKEKIESFLMRLKLQAKKCNYVIPARNVEINDIQQTVALYQEDISETLIRDRIVVGIADHATKTRLLRDHNLTLETAVSLVKAGEMADKRIQTLLTTNAASINAIGQRDQESRQNLKLTKETDTKPASKIQMWILGEPALTWKTRSVPRIATTVFIVRDEQPLCTGVQIQTED